VRRELAPYVEARIDVPIPDQHDHANRKLELRMDRVWVLPDGLRLSVKALDGFVLWFWIVEEGDITKIS